MLALIEAVKPVKKADFFSAIHLDDVPMAIWGFLAACVVLIVVLHLGRSRLANQTWRDFLGISETFLVLFLFMALMIFGEHALG